MFSIYTAGFNIIKNNYDYKTAFKNYQEFADEIIVCTLEKNEDETLDVLNEISHLDSRIKIITSKLDRNDPLFWGKLRDQGLQKCTQEFCISLDLDELVPIWQKFNWINYARQLSFSDQDAYLVPLINLWGEKEYIRWDKDTNYLFKWALHKNPNLSTRKIKRGAVNFALKNNIVDIDKSDTNELIYEDGSLVNSQRIITEYNGDSAKYIEECTAKIFIYHTGYLNFNDKILRNKNFWNDQFKIQAGFNQIDSANKFAPLEHSSLTNKNILKHNLKLWDEIA